MLAVTDDADILNAISRAGPCDAVSDIRGSLLFDYGELHGALTRMPEDRATQACIVVDFSRISDDSRGDSDCEIWSTLTEQLTATYDCRIITLYSLERLLENRMQATLRAHPQFVVPSGVYDNPFWMPPGLTTRGTLDEQMAFLLARVMPDYTDMAFFAQSERSNARGANPQWLPAPKHIEVINTPEQRWHIHCLGPLRVYKEGDHWVDWKLRGGSPNKTRTLFAYLLQAGEKGAHVDRIGELLWSSTIPEKVKRARLHHAVAMLRKTLDDTESVIRSGEFYRLNAPANSWTDISGFEQTCRRGLALFRSGDEEEALRVYLSAERLYCGDLFEDIPVEYVHSELEDWCLPRRRWLREMAVKLFRDMSVLLRSQSRTDEALEKCQKALKLDSANEEANTEAMRIFHAQGRVDAITRQYHQYLSACDEVIGGAPESAAIHRLHVTLLH